MRQSEQKQLQIFDLVEESFQSWGMARLLGSSLCKAIGAKRGTRKIKMAREEMERWLADVRARCRAEALQARQLAPMEYHEILTARAQFGDFPHELPDLRGQHRGPSLPNLRKVRWRYQEVLTHVKARRPHTVEQLRQIVPTLSHARAKHLVGQNDYLVAAAITADEFGMKSSTILRKTKGFPMSVANDLGDWQLDVRGRCTFRPWIRGGRDLGKPVRVGGFGDLPRGFRPNTGDP